MVIIRFRNGADWYKANWVFRQLIADVIDIFPDDAALKHELEKAEAFGSLPLDRRDETVATRIIDAIKTVAQLTVEGKISGWKKSKPDDHEGQRMYLEAMSELLKTITI